MLPDETWWRIEWPEDISTRFHNTLDKTCPASLTITIAHLELACLVIGFTMLLDQHGEAVRGQAILALADSLNSVQWVNRAGARDQRAGDLIRMLGVKEAVAGTSLLSNHIAGDDNVIADAISRLPILDLTPFLLSNPPTSSSHWKQVYPPTSLIESVLTLLRASTC